MAKDSLSADLESLKIDRNETASGGPLRSVLLTLVALGLLVAAGVFAYPHLEARFFKAKLRTGTVVSVTPSQATTQLTATGYVVARTLSRAAPQVIARVVRVVVAEGDTVEAGALLYELDTADQRSLIAAAQAKMLASRAEVASRRATLKETEQQLERARRLAESGAGARSTADDLAARVTAMQATVEAAEAAASAARAEVEVHRTALGRLTVLAPIAGTIVNDPPEVGDVVNPELSATEIADFSSIVVEVDVPESRLASVRVGGPTEIVLEAFGGKRFRGEVREIGKRVNRSKATLVVRVGFVDAAEGVLPDMSARVAFLSAALDDDALAAAAKTMIPAAAVVERGGRRVVFAVVDGKAREVPVELGEQAGSDYVLLAGLEPGARVVLDPPDTLHTGQGVQEASE